MTNSEVPRYWRKIRERDRFATEIVIPGNDYDVVKGFGNSYHIISKNGHENVQLSGVLDAEIIYPKLKEANRNNSVYMSGENGNQTAKGTTEISASSD